MPCVRPDHTCSVFSRILHIYRRKLTPCHHLVPAQPVDATLYPRWKDGVYSVISEESRLSASSQAHLNKVVRQLNERPRKALGIETPAAKGLLQVLRRPVETPP